MSKSMTEEETHKENIIEQNYFKEKTRFEIIEEKVKKTLFGVLNILLKFEDDDFSDEVIDLLNETCQFLYYPFYDPMGYLWKKEALFSGISKFLSYFQTVVFFNNTELYIVVFYLLMAVVLGVVVDVGYVAYIISSKNKSGAVWPMRLLRSVVSYIVTVLFNPMVEYFLAILECSDFDEEGNPLDYYQNYNVDDMHCWTDVHFTVMCVEGVFITVIFVLICTVVMTIFYEQKTSMDKKEAKTSSYADLTSLFVKIILILIYSFLVWTKSYHWIVVPATTLTCFLQFYVYWTERPFYDERTNIAFFIHTGIVFYSTVVLLLLKILENAAFDGGIFILFIGGVMVSYIIITQKDKRFNLLLMNINKFSEGGSVFKQLRYFLELVDKSHTDRRSNILLKGYIYVHEESCTNSECPLKRYLQEIEKSKKSNISPDKSTLLSGVNNNITTNMNMNTNDSNVNKAFGGQITDNTSNINNNIAIGTTTGGEGILGGGNKEKSKNSHTDEDLYLYQYVMTMYQNGTSKFPLSTTLRINFSFFLMERMNNTKKALLELKNCEKYNPSFEEEFIIFRYCENQTAQENEAEDEGDDDEGLDIVANIAYKNHQNTFKEGLTSITSIYYDFWSLLLNNTQKSDEDLAKMNEYGEKINKLVEVVKSHYAEMEKLKYNDGNMLKLYADFFQDILNDKTQAEYYRGRLRDIQGEGGLEKINSNDPADTSNENIDYIFLTAEGSQIGKIVKCSPNFCSLLGYTPSELIGKNVNFIMPEIFHSYHQKLLVENASRFKTQMTQNVRIGVTGNQKSNFKELFVIAKNKQNQAVPLSLKITLIYLQELTELFFIGRLYNEEMYENFNLQNPSPGVPPIINFNMKVCFVLTNLDFIVQYYTPNAANFLGLKMGSSGNVDVTKNIIEFNNDDNLETKHLSKGEILCKRYAQPKLIIWKTLLNDEANNDEDNNNNDIVKKWDMKGFWSFSNELSKKKEGNETLEQTILKKTKVGNPFVFKRQRYKEDSFKLTVTETSIKGTTLGYIFRFEVFDNNDDADVNGFDEKNQELRKLDSIINVDPSFIPHITRKFALDTENYGFYTTEYVEEEENEEEEVNNMNDWHKKLKQLAEDKINKFKQRKRDMENEEEEMEEEEEDSHNNNEGEEIEDNGDNYGYGYFSKKVTLNKQSSLLSNESGAVFSKRESITKDNLIRQESISNHPNLKSEILIGDKDKDINPPIQPVQKIKYEFDYYHIQGINTIRFLIYDFKKGRLVDVPKIKRESQVEYRKKEGIPNFLGGPSKDKIVRDINDDDDGQEIETAEVKRIEYALQKEQFQPEIVKLKWTSLAIYMVIMGISIILLYLIIENYNEINEKILMINNSRILQTDLLLGLYYIRELTLLSMNKGKTKENGKEKYKTHLYDEEYMLKNITKTLNDLFDRSSLLERSMESTKIKWSNNRENILIKKNANISILDDFNDNLRIIEVESKSFSALTELLGNLFEVVNLKTLDIIQTNRYVYFYTSNVYNPFLDILNQYTNNIILQLNDSISNYKKNFLFVIFFSLILLLVGGFFIKIILDKISRRKSGYLEVFFQIDNKVCLKALEKCDKYAKFLNQAQPGEEDGTDSEDNNFIKKNMKEEKKANDNTHKKIKPSNNKTCINIKTTFEIAFLILFVFLFYLVVIIIFEQNLDKMNNYSELYNILSVESIQYQSTFDILREYFFDHTGSTGGKSFKNILESNLKNVYEDMKKQEIKFIYDKLPSKFKKKYSQITTNDLCIYTKNLFLIQNNTEYNFNYITKNNYTCDEIGENSTKYGLDLLVSNFLYELRVQKKYFDIILAEASSMDYTYNNTLYGNNKYYSKLKEENIVKNNYNEELYEELDPFKIFNEEHVFKLSMIRRYFLLPIYNNTLNDFYNSMKDFWSTSYDIFLAVMIVFLLLITVFYLAYWIPSIYLKDESIYKTKNMLAIIPKDVLTGIPGINKLLNLGNITLFSGVWNQSESQDKNDKNKKRGNNID